MVAAESVYCILNSLKEAKLRISGDVLGYKSKVRKHA